MKWEPVSFAQVIDALERQGFAPRPAGSEWLARCPAHDDHRPSLGVREGDGGKVLLHCRSRGCEFFDILTKLGLRNNGARPERPRTPQQPRAIPQPFDPKWARFCWKECAGRRDQKAESYLASRHLSRALDLDLCRVLPPDVASNLATRLEWWPRKGYRIVAPLFDDTGELVNIVARRIVPCTDGWSKNMLPKDSEAKGMALANPAALAMLRGEDAADWVCVPEGVSDFCAVASHVDSPVLATVTLTAADAIIGPWAHGRRVLIAVDRDDAGDKAAPKIAARAYARGASKVQRFAWPGNATDACDALAAMGEERFAAFVRQGGENG